MFYFKNIVPIVLFLLSGIASCSSNDVDIIDRSWAKAEDSCIYESDSPPLRRAINYVDTELCGRRVLEKKERKKRLRDLLN
ncbi:MAG: hypothetical protein HQM14_00860 [SAR324 cluster bacterium]|nr:hypothetical protein [SAR324 cluster bacterium]